MASKWIPTACGMCYVGCGVLVQVEDGLVVVDPIGGNAASKADEWVPIRPGTDTAFAMGKGVNFNIGG